MAQAPSTPKSSDGFATTPSATPYTIEAALMHLRETLDSHRLTPSPASLFALRGAVSRLATHVEALPRHARKGETAKAVLESAHVLWASGFHNFQPPAEDVERASHGLHLGWPGIVSAMLLTPCWAWSGAPRLDQVPDWLWGHFMHWVLNAPLAAAPGVADAYVTRITHYIWELAGWMERNRGSEAVRAAGEAFLDHDSTPLLLQATRDLKPYATARGRLVDAIAHTRSGDTKPVALPRTGRSLRVGILARNFGDCADNRTLLPILRNLDPGRVELALFATNAAVGPVESAFKSVAPIFHILPDSRAAQLGLIAQSMCDVLIYASDIAGTTDAFTGLAMQRLAPLQAVLPSIRFTTGIPAVDLRLIGEATAEPSTERLALLPGSGLAFPDASLADTNASLPLATRTEFGLPETGAVFISAAHPDLIGAEILGAWSRLLRAVPGSSLVLILPGSANPFLAEELPARISAFADVDGSRVVVSLDDSRRALSLGGIYLDTFPTSDPEPLAAAVRTGIPAVAWCGGTHRSLTGAALLRELGGAALVASDEAGYIARASKLASDEAGRVTVGAALAASSCGSDSLALADAITGLFERAFAEVLQGTCKRPACAPIHLGFSPGEVETLRTNTLDALQCGQFGDAVATTRLWLQGEPSSADARLLHARALRLAGQTTRAVTYALAALNGNEDAAESWLEAAAALRANHQAKEAITAYETALKLDGTCVDAWTALSELAAEAGHHEFAAEAAKTARELKPDAPRAAALALSA
ncbi:MAG TPA: hypothetical protein VMM36_09530 [Opitutaceae bacterium]|nr:hypothetical protein [Opitutaceae bacterium]